jgi:hypothetical protein
MRRAPILTALFLVAAPATAHASGVNLAWNDCSYSGTMNRSFACNTNSGSHQLVASFVLNDTLSVSGAVGIVDLCLGGVNLTPWWQFNLGSCRQGALTASAAVPLSAQNCADFWQGQATAGISAYQVGFDGWDSARILVSVSMPSATFMTTEAYIENHAFTVLISNASTVGTGACGGCNYGACIVLNEIELFRSYGGSVRLQVPDTVNQATWQGGVPGCPFIVPVANRTWGQVKSLYR